MSGGRVLITGAAGLVGSRLVSRCLREGLRFEHRTDSRDRFPLQAIPNEIAGSPHAAGWSVPGGSNSSLALVAVAGVGQARSGRDRRATFFLVGISAPARPLEPASKTIASRTLRPMTPAELLRRVHGCAFDDFLLAPQFSVVARRDPTRIDLTSRLTTKLVLKRPIVSANMDTVTRAPMAIVQAEGQPRHHRSGFRPGEIEGQVREIQIVKRTQHGVVSDPYTIPPDAGLEQAIQLMQRSGVGTLVVVDAARRLLGLLTERDVRFVSGARVADRMTPVGRLTVHEGAIGIDEAERVMVEHKVKKLPLVDGDGRLLGLITARTSASTGDSRSPRRTRKAG